MGAIIAALLALGSLIPAGAWLIRRLKLPTDLPETCRFEPRPPPAGNPDEALERAKLSRQRQQACDQAATAWRDAEAVVLAWQEIKNPDRPCGEHNRAQLVAQADELKTTSKAAAERAAEHMHDDSPETALQITSEAATLATEQRSTAEALIASLPPEPANHRKLILLAALLVIVVLWLVVVLPMLTASAAS
ncbi:MAG: hypothetical protein PF961_19485 [Planctomycetota bacterium]|jgi:hypothetical protein|nr:hypothetical protein [Planctomycetota bacterium]